MRLEEFHRMKKAEKEKPKRKYGNKPTWYRGHKCDSIKESKDLASLDMLFRIKDIRWFAAHPVFLLPGDYTYTADAIWCGNDGVVHVQDSKGGTATITQDFKDKVKLIREIFGIEIEIV